MVNLRTTTAKTLVDSSRGEIDQLYAADDLVAFSVRSKGVIIVGELNGPGLVKRFRIQSSRSVLVLTCRHRTVACAVHLENYTLVYIWNYDTSQCRSFEINRAALKIPMASHMGHGLLLQPKTETMILCQVSAPPHSETSHATLLQWRFSYTGECLRNAEQVLERYDKGSALASRELNSGLTFIPVSHDGLYMLQGKHNIYGAPTARSLQYDDRNEAFTSPQWPGLYPVNTRNCGDISWWKDVFVETGVHEKIIIHRGTVSVPNFDSDVTHVSEQQETFEDLLINDKYMVRPFAGALYVFCYDHTVQLPDTKGSLHGIGLWEVIENRFPTASECQQES
ncbi:hypothetical protein E8E12_006370 [Didymella heteroderae]|uniref:Uncharacterized protein n=1 Tax=Didymella heteroderae TaxID=1769908 RepID=A0A9P4WNV9_9PLEO|nr:hypothetical protein E8E12_006370 [Didymella heteroderae]